jgi:hydroxylamine reductase (hybrid-cluster protein)
MEELLKQIEGTGIDVYTHSEMLPANCYPAFKKYDHFVGNYGGPWWLQNTEFESFNGPILLTTNCLVPLKKSNTYLDRLFTTGVVGYEESKAQDKINILKDRLNMLVTKRFQGLLLVIPRIYTIMGELGRVEKIDIDQ